MQQWFVWSAWILGPVFVWWCGVHAHYQLVPVAMIQYEYHAGYRVKTVHNSEGMGFPYLFHTRCVVDLQGTFDLVGVVPNPWKEGELSLFRYTQRQPWIRVGQCPTGTLVDMVRMDLSIWHELQDSTKAKEEEQRQARTTYHQFLEAYSAAAPPQGGRP